MCTCLVKGDFLLRMVNLRKRLREISPLSLYKLTCASLAFIYIITTYLPEQSSAPGERVQALQDEKVVSKKGDLVTISMFSPPAGMFHPLLYSDAYTANLLACIFESLVRLNPELEWEPALAREWYFENEGKTLVFRLRENVYWHDGTPFTALDVQYTYSVLAHPDYMGVRQHYVRDLQGFEAYHQGKESTFSGVEVVDDYTVKFHFKQANVASLYRASSLIIPQHVYGKYPVKDLAKAEESLTFNKLIGTGPYQAEEYVSNEAYILVKNNLYWQGTPKIERLIWRVINQDVAPGLLANEELDIVTSPGGVRAADYELVKSIPHIKLFETPSFGYQYLGFKLNYRPVEDVEKNIVNPNNYIPNAKLQSKELRKAIMYALDRQGMVDGLLKGRGSVQHSPFSSAWPQGKGNIEYVYDPQQAKRILDEAGYIDRDGDGYREQPNGEKLTLSLHYPTGDKVREKSALVIERNLQEVGIKVRLHAPRDPGTHFANVEQDKQNIDLFLGGWSLSIADPDPRPIWDTHSLWNFSRWADPFQQRLLDKAAGDPQTLDQAYRWQLYDQWATYVQEELPIIFLYHTNDIYAYHQRIKGVIESPLGIFYQLHNWEIAG